MSGFLNRGKVGLKFLRTYLLKGNLLKSGPVRTENKLINQMKSGPDLFIDLILELRENFSSYLLQHLICSEKIKAR